jgi:hypothetical protein
LFVVVQMLVWGFGFGSGKREGQHDDTWEWRYWVVVGGRKVGARHWLVAARCWWCCG